MNNIIKRVWNQNRMVNIEDLSGMAFQAESGGHTFEISGIDDAGAAVPLSGTVAGVFRRPDNADIALTGSASDGVVSVTLTEDCYAVAGRFGLTIFVTSNSQKVAVYAAVGTIAQTSGGAVAGDTPQDVVDLINAIEAAIAEIPASYTDIMAAIAPTYSSSALYSVGDYVWYDGVLKRCIVPITTAETYTAAHWSTVSIGSDLSNGVISRANITSTTNLNDLIRAGYYFKDRNVSAPNGVNSARAKVLCLNRIGSSYGLVQLWFDTDNNDIYERVQTSSGIGWTSWERIITTKSLRASIKISLPIHSVTEVTDKWASSTGNLTRSRATTKRYKVKGAYSLSISWSPSGNDSLWVFRYDANGDPVSHASFSTSPVTISNLGTTEYIALSVYSSVNNVIPSPDITISAVGIENIEEVKNPSFGSNVSGTRWYRFGYSVGTYEDANGDLQNIANTGMMMLPPNYSAEGKPVPVIIMVHGSDAYQTINGTEVADYEPFFNYLNDCGYALIDCYGWTKRYDSLGTGLHNPWPIPTTNKAYESLLHLMLYSFNLDASNVFVMSKSLGGKVCSWIAATQKVNAAGFLAPALALNFGYADSKYRTIMVEDMGLIGIVNADLGWASADDCLADFVSNYRTWSNDKRIAFFQANEQNIMGVDPEFINLVGGAAAEKLENSATNTWTDGYNRVSYAPTKVWVANDDTSISPAACARHCQQIRNGGGFAELRIMPNGTGGHHSVDTDANAPQKTSVTTPLGYTYASVPLAYYELWEFFERFKKNA